MMLKHRRSSIEFGIFAILGLLLLGLLSFCIWILTLDRRGTFHNTTSLSDLDDDGDLDVILQNVRNESEFTAFAVTTLWYNQGAGQFVASRLEDFQHEPGWASTAGDVDQDGDLDLLVFHGYRLRLVFNQGGAEGGQAGKFGNSQGISAPNMNAQFGSLLMGDLNNDGLLDGIVTGCCGRVFTLDPDEDTPNYSWAWINASNAAGRLAPHSSVLSALDGLSLRAAALGDLDSDGDLDLFAAVIAPSQGRNIDPADRVLFNDGSGNFADSGQRLGETDSTAVALGDLDDDDDLDVLVGNESGALVWINQGKAQGGQAGTFSLSDQEIPGGGTRAVFLSDLDGDSDLDALIAGLRQATIWWNDGQGGFTQTGQRFRYSNRHGLAVDDFNGDNQPDIFAAEYSNNYRIWFNQGNGIFRTWP